ncbi:MAG: hypothetical protein ACXU8O_02265 [Asticcacaulis sp.]
MNPLRFMILCAPLAVAALATPGLASAQAATTQTPAATQSVTVAEPDLSALKPAAPGTAPANPNMPHWSEFPVAPTNVPKAPEFAQRVQAQEQNRAELRAGLAAIQWEAFQPEAIKADAQAQIDPSKLAPVDAEMSPEQTEALAQSLRAEATPPPVAQ